MSRKRYSPEEIIGKLREAEVLLRQDKIVSEVAVVDPKSWFFRKFRAVSRWMKET